MKVKNKDDVCLNVYFLHDQSTGTNFSNKNPHKSVTVIAPACYDEIINNVA